MRKNFKKLVTIVAAVPAMLAVTVNSAFAQVAAAAPTTGTALAQTVDMSDAKSAGLITIGVLVSAGVVLWGARLVLSKFQPRL